MQHRSFCTETYFSKSMKNHAKLSKSLEVFFENFSPLWILLQRLVENVKSVAYKSCSFRRKRAFPRKWAARCIQEKLFVISFLTFVFIFFLLKSILPSKTWPKTKLSWLFSQSFYLSRKNFCKLFSKSIPPTGSTFPLAPRKYSEVLFDLMIFPWKENFSAAKGWFSGMWHAWIVLLVHVIVSEFLNAPFVAN